MATAKIQNYSLSRFRTPVYISLAEILNMRTSLIKKITKYVQCSPSRLVQGFMAVEVRYFTSTLFPQRTTIQTA